MLNTLKTQVLLLHCFVFGCTTDIYLGLRYQDSVSVIDSESSTDSKQTDIDTGPAEPELLDLVGDLEVSDPTIIQYNETYIIFHTGPGISVKRSDNLLTWHSVDDIFATLPNWITADYPDTKALWSPDISFHNDTYFLYYSISTFGSNVSCVGLAVSDNLNEGTVWNDQGPVVCTNSDDNWNAIDPNYILDENKEPWLVLGSYWTGIKAIRLNSNGMREDDEIYDISSRISEPDTTAPVIINRNGIFYHFVSFDKCCQGIDSTTNLRVGRSETLLGPYFDYDGVAMLEGGGTLILESNERWKGPGHNAILEVDGNYYNVYHAHDAENDGIITLRISTIVWDDNGLPIVAGP